MKIWIKLQLKMNELNNLKTYFSYGSSKSLYTTSHHNISRS